MLIADTITNEVDLITLGPTPELQLGCVGNAASFLAGPLAPNEIVSLFGQNVGPAEPVFGQPDSDNLYPTQLGGTQVTFDGIPSPVFYVSAAQINAVTPRSLDGKTTTRVCLLVNGAVTNCIDAPVQRAAPAIFLNGKTAAALNQDGTINSQSNPAPVGSIVSIFATGIGTMTPAPPDGAIVGLPLPVQNLQVRMSTVVGLDSKQIRIYSAA